MEQGCWTCGAPLPPRLPGPGRNRRYCRALCASRAKHRRSPTPPREDTSCPQCGKVVEQVMRRGVLKVYCSDQCKTLAYAGGVQPVSRRPRAKREVFERHGWTCGICTEAIDPALLYPDLRSATVDHVIPLSQGGPDDEGNLQAAHFLCNIRKRSPNLQRGGLHAWSTEGADRTAPHEGSLART